MQITLNFNKRRKKEWEHLGSLIGISVIKQKFLV